MTFICVLQGLSFFGVWVIFWVFLFVSCFFFFLLGKGVLLGFFKSVMFMLVLYTQITRRSAWIYSVASWPSNCNDSIASYYTAQDCLLCTIVYCTAACYGTLFWVLSKMQHLNSNVHSIFQFKTGPHVCCFLKTEGLNSNSWFMEQVFSWNVLSQGGMAYKCFCISSYFTSIVLSDH